MGTTVNSRPALPAEPPNAFTKFMAQADPNIHHGEGMTCVWRAEIAVCRKAKLGLGLPADDTPDESQCRANCQNLAYTDRDIDQIRQRLPLLDDAATDPLAPRPLRDRATAQAVQARQIVQRHDPAEARGTTG